MQLINMMPLGDLVVANPAATRVFLRHRLDFCCGGKRSLEDACREAGLAPAAIVAELEQEERGDTSIHWDQLTQRELADQIESHYHAALRRDVPPLVEAARKVERVHARKPAVPAGLADTLAEFLADMEAHMQKEENILFPMIRRGVPGEAVYMPIRVMEREHESHAEHLARIRRLTCDLRLPAYACATWTALYRGLEAMEAELFEHIHLENNILFSRAIRGAA
jgi:regulator of cell morphogenesis and NO signaling